MGFVYFISLDEKYVKIGYSQFPYRRFLEIKAYNPTQLSLLGMHEGNISVERKLHKKFRHLRVRNEWFLLDSEIEDYIAEFCEMPDYWEVDQVSAAVVNYSDFRQSLFGYLNLCRQNKERFVVQKRGEPLAAVIPIEDLKFLEELEEAQTSLSSPSSCAIY